MQENKKHTVYVIIVTYNAMRWVDKCLTCLRESTVATIPIIIDNGSKDETVAYIEKNYPECHIIVNKNNRGFGQANNQGIEWAYKQGATHFFLLNQDAWVHPNTFEKLIEVQEKYDIYLVSPMHLNGTGDHYDRGFYKTTILPPAAGIEYVSDLTFNNLKPYYSADSINAAGWMLSRKCIEDIGGFDPIFFHYGEDRNYCQRVRYHSKGKPCVVYVPGAYMHHDRELHGNVVMYNQRRSIARLLMFYGDINHFAFRPSKEKLLFHYGNGKLFIRNLICFRFVCVWQIVKSYFELLFLLPKLFHNRKQNKQVMPSWLQIN